MRIGFLLDSFPILSETFILNQITGLIDRKCDIHIFIASDSNDKQFHRDVEEYSLLQHISCHNDKPQILMSKIAAALPLFVKYFFKHPRIVLNSLNVFRYGKEALSLNLFFKATHFLKYGSFDVLFCHYGHNGEVGVILKNLGFKFKILTMFHGYDLRKVANREVVFDNLFKDGDIFLSISQYADEVLKGEVVESSRIIRHRVGIDLNKFSPINKISNALFPVRIVTVSRLAKEKDLNLALKIIRCLVDKGVDQINYTIVGDGPLSTEIKNQIALLNLEKYVNLTGALKQENVIKHLQESDIFLLTSRHENLPVCLMEAQACGLPVVTTNAGSANEIIQNESTGYIISEPDVELFTEKLMKLINDRNLREEMGNRGREFIVKNYDINILNDKLLKIFNSAIL